MRNSRHLFRDALLFSSPSSGNPAPELRKIVVLSCNSWTTALISLPWIGDDSIFSISPQSRRGELEANLRRGEKGECSLGAKGSLGKKEDVVPSKATLSRSQLEDVLGEITVVLENVQHDELGKDTIEAKILYTPS